MNKNKIVYEMVIDGVELTTKNLNSHGINSRDIKKLVYEKVLERTQRGYYRLIDPVYKLFGYGKECMRQDKDLRNKCFKKCLEIYPEHYSSTYELFLSCILNQNFKESIPYLKVLYKQNKRVFGLHLYLISFIVDLPEELKEITRNLTYEDIELTNQDIPNLEYENYVRKMAINNKFISASQYLNSLVELTSGVNLYQQVVRILIQKAVKVFDNIIDYERKLIKEEDYIELQSFLEKSTNFRRLSKAETYLLKLTKEILRIENTGKLPSVNNEEVVDVFLAIDNNNYKLALEISANQFQKYRDGNLIYLMLLNINDLINNIMEQERKDNVKYIQEFYIALSQNDFETARKILDKITLSSDKESLKELLTATEKIAVSHEIPKKETTKEEDIEEHLRKKYEYMKESDTPVLLLDAMSLEHEKILLGLVNKFPNLESFKVGNIIPYIMLRIHQDINVENLERSAYLAYENGKYDNSIKYVKMLLSNASNIKTKISLFYLLSKSLIRIGKEKEAVNYLEICDELIKEKGLESICYELISAIKSGNKEAVKSIIDNNKEPIVLDSILLELINKLQQEMIEHNDVYRILPTSLSDDLTKEKIKAIVRTIPNLWCFRINGNADEAHIILMQKSNNRELNTGELYKSARDFYAKEEYDKAIDLLKIIIANSHRPDGYLINYLKVLAYCYLKSYNKKAALECFTISDGLSKKLGYPPIHSRLIDALKDELDLEEYIKIKYNQMIREGKCCIKLDINKEKMYFVKACSNIYFLYFDDEVYIKPLKESKKDLKKLKSEAFGLYTFGSFDKALELAIEAVNCSSNIGVIGSLYYLIGSIYYRLRDYSLASYYLNISLKIANNFKNKMAILTIQKLLNKINEIVSQKPNVNLTEFSFELNYYGIDKIEQIAHLICGSGLSVHEACEKFNLNLEQEMLVNLILARDAYINENYTLGDKYLRVVERTKGKTPQVKQLLKEIQKDKIFYKNRKDSYKPLTIQPIKKA